MKNIQSIKLISIVCLLLFVASCSPGVTPTATSTPEPIITPTQQPPFTGKLFFDMNGSGLQDESSFVYDSKQLQDPRQPLQSDLQKAINVYVNSHLGLKDGDIVTISEPGLSGYQVCLEKECANTSQDGSFSIQNNTGQTTPLLEIADPNAEKPALSMKYINFWKGSVTIPEYDVEGIKIDIQKLNDIDINKIDQGVYLSQESNNQIGLAQGILTYPFLKNESFYIYSWMDLDPRAGKSRRYDGDTHDVGWIKWPTKPIIGTADTHNGIDFVAKEGSPIISMAPGIVFYVASPDDQIKECLNIFVLHKFGDNYFLSQYGHNSKNLVKEGQTVARGQVIGLVGHSCTKLDHIHFAWLQVPRNSENAMDGGQKRGLINNAVAIDTYRDIQNVNSISFWTIDNLPETP
jgi:murein DD-endopeptidase MepM/ murein hydrolase activator NlpD